MIKRLGIICLLVFVIGSVNGQSKQELINYGDAAYKQMQYPLAATYYLKLLGAGNIKSSDLSYPYEIKSVVPPKKEKEEKPTEGTKDSIPDTKENYAIHMLAACYRKIRSYDKAETWYKKAVNTPHSQFKDAKLWYADALMKNGKYGEAKTQLDEFIQEFDDVESPLFDRAQQFSLSCDMADQAKTREDIEVYKPDSLINTGTTSFAANYYGDEATVVFSSARDGGTIDDDSPMPSRYLSDLYMVGKDGRSYMDLRPFGAPVNSGKHEAAGGLSIDRQTFYYTQWNPYNKSECAVYVSKFFNNQWMLPLKLNDYVNVEGYQSKEPSLSLDGTTLYFSSNRPGGEGGFDIWYCEIDEFGNVKPAQNAGPVINTPGDEVSPFYHYLSQTLYFSSDGHQTLGGLDVMRSTYDEDDNTWSKPENLGLPINSSKDETYFVINENQSEGFFTSDKEACSECNDEKYADVAGNCNKVYAFSKKPMHFKIIGTVYNSETEQIITNSLVTFKDIKGGNDPVFLMTDEEGGYMLELQPNQEWFIKAQKKGFFGDAAAISTVGLLESKTFVQDFYLTPIPEGEVAIEGIYYDFDSPKLRPESKKTLDDLIEFLNLNDNITVEIASHTDSRGSDSYNLRLSEGRAQSVVNYLIANGIDKDRLIAKGYGETKPLDDCSKYPECGDTRNEDCDCHQRNRRTAFTTISENELYNLKTE